MIGQGKATFPNGNISEGSYKFDARNGPCRETLDKGKEIHEGHYFDDQKNGAFKIQYADGESYEGEYRDNKR